jgi:hypothetical protein
MTSERLFGRLEPVEIKDSFSRSGAQKPYPLTSHGRWNDEAGAGRCGLRWSWLKDSWL